MNAVVQSPAPTRKSALVALAGRMGVEADKLFVDSLRAVAFKAPNVSNEQLLALCVVANEYSLNPFTKELFAFPDRQNGIVPVVSVDGWARIINTHHAFDGIEFNDLDGGVECVIYRKDRNHPTRVTEYMDECRRDTAPWKSHPRRMLRHKALIQCARIAFGFGGIYDEDEAKRIVETTSVQVVRQTPAESRVAQAAALLAPVQPATEIEQDQTIAAEAIAIEEHGE
jgi:phage recombination protein Bet